VTKIQANKLKVGDRVYYRGRIPGEVVHINPGACINVQWEDGERSATHPADAESWTLKREEVSP
jgi:hypothetical protein